MQAADWQAAVDLTQPVWVVCAPGRCKGTQTVQLQGRGSCKPQMADYRCLLPVQLAQGLVLEGQVQPDCLWLVAPEGEAV